MWPKKSLQSIYQSSAKPSTRPEETKTHRLSQPHFCNSHCPQAINFNEMQRNQTVARIEIIRAKTHNQDTQVFKTLRKLYE
jgi:hypothetical protein